MISEEQNIDIDKVIDGCKAGNRKAQEQLYRKFYKAMMNLCLRYTKNDMEALEALNTGFYKVYKSIYKYNASKASVYTWIRTIIINSCLDLIKVQQKQTGVNEIDQVVTVHVPPDVISKMSASEILELVRKLPPATQAVFNLYVIEGYSHVEIAAIAGISEGTSKWHLSEARKKLQNMINEQVTDE